MGQNHRRGSFYGRWGTRSRRSLGRGIFDESPWPRTPPCDNETSVRVKGREMSALNVCREEHKKGDSKEKEEYALEVWKSPSQCPAHGSGFTTVKFLALPPGMEAAG